MTQLRGLYIIRQNVPVLMKARQLNQTDVSSWLGKGKSWINKFLKGTRQIQLKDLDRLADILGVATYQLFQPGIARSAERRISERRRRGERRIAHAERLASSGPQAEGTHDRPVLHADQLQRLQARLNEILLDLATLAAGEIPNGQISNPRARKARTSKVAP